MITKASAKRQLRDEIKALAGEDLGVIETAMLEGMSLGELEFAYKLAKERWGNG
jgi:hypothetical protein